ncbi:MAG: F0F1 ATP synthase subunit delta [Actinomycetota bacterium]|nr:F0F1 ATP synthase subunit delta [Actinomycetota bacterium]
MRGSSGKSLAAVVEHLEQVLESADSTAETTGDELFSVAGLLDGAGSLRRTLTDPSLDARARSGLAGQVLGDRVSEPTKDVVAHAAAQRWTSSRDFADSIEHAGVVAHVAAADSAGRIDDVEDELFRLGRIISGDPALRDTLSDRSAPTEGKQQILNTLLADKAAPATQRLAAQAVAGRHTSPGAALEEFAKVAATRRDRLVATVTVAQPLSDDDHERLAAALATQYGAPVHLNVVVDKRILGGARVELGDEVVEGTVQARLETARRRVAG